MHVRAAPQDRATQRSAEPQPRTGLPVKQLLILVTILLAEPLTNAIIRSFTDASTLTNSGQGLTNGNTDTPETRGGLYSQLLESSLFLAKAATAYHWGRLSDKLGRRPILLIGSLGLGLSTSILGATHNVWLQTTMRSMQGIFAGNMETAKSVIAEVQYDSKTAHIQTLRRLVKVTDSTNRHRAYAALPLMQSMGISIGSSIGNLMTGLHEKFPALQYISFIRDHPLFIPCSVASAFSFLAFHLTYYGFEETLSPEFHVDWKTLWNLRNRVGAAVDASLHTATSSLLDQSSAVRYGAVENVQHAAENLITNARQEVQDRVMKLLPVGKFQEGLHLKELMGPPLIIALLNYSFVSFLDQSQQILLPLMYTSPVDAYGLGLSSDDMTKIMAKWAGYNATAQLVLFPWLLKRYGPKRVYATCLSSMMVFFSLFPVAHMTTKYLGYVAPVVWGVISIQMTICSLLYMAYGCTQMFIMDAVPDKGSLGSVNGIGQSVGSSARMIAPPLITIAFSYAQTLGDQWYWGYSVYVLLACVTAVGTMVSALLPGLEKSLAHSKNRADNDDGGAEQA